MKAKISNLPKTKPPLTIEMSEAEAAGVRVSLLNRTERDGGFHYPSAAKLHSILDRYLDAECTTFSVIE